MTAIAASRQLVSRTPLREGRAGLEDWHRITGDTPSRSFLPRIGSGRVHEEACPILLVQQKANPLTQCQCAVLAEIVVEVAQFGH